MVQVVPKKGGTTMIKTKNNTLIPSRNSQVGEFASTTEN